ncbi:LuxR C-terminal-related transcriptional regulator [Burkholderia vietnamiensis]|uniref:LuxR C-terminal-related transcriptional regulator n=1 Tax=Burkholderia vietnamiensis TaxID=60552 RepID=UPI000A8BCD00|nr:LuxR C-terminal-related transcriptional regulator [Burkholderia vietnamiensis]MCA8395503.1 LuxR C-terminal-related transcriptional regulator [Burkholderia vietnamiensis]
MLKRLAYGDGISDIAKDLGLNSKTISTYKARLLAKLDLRNDAALSRYAIEQQIIEPD